MLDLDLLFPALSLTDCLGWWTNLLESSKALFQNWQEVVHKTTDSRGFILKQNENKLVKTIARANTGEGVCETCSVNPP